MKKDTAYWESLGDQYGTGSRVKIGSRERAKYYYQQALELDPNNPLLWFKLSGEVSGEEALKCIDKALRHSPDNIEFLLKKSEMLTRDFVNRLDEAESVLSRVLEIDPDNIQALLLKSRIWREKTRYAVKNSEIHGDITATANLAINLLEAGMDCEALKYLEKGMEDYPDDKFLWTTKYWLLQANRFYSEADAIPDEKLLFRHSTSVEDFLRTGSFGPVHLGMTREEVIDLLGKPESVIGWYPSMHDQIKNKHFTRITDDAYPIWGYGCVELGFGEERRLLSSISLDHVERWTAPIYWSYSIKVDPWIYRRPLGGTHYYGPMITKKEFESGLKDAKIDYEDEGRVPVASSWLGYLRLESGVEAIYEEHEGTTFVGFIHNSDEQFDDE